MCVGSPTAGAWSSFQRRPDDEFETDRSPKLLDFGLAHAVDDGAIMGGTLPYISPEVLASRPAEEADDVWSLRVVLDEIASERHPFASGALEAVRSRIRPAGSGDGRGRLRGVDPDGPPVAAAGDRVRLRRGAGRSLRERVAICVNRPVRFPPPIRHSG